MRIDEIIKPIKPLTPDKLRIQSLQRNVERSRQQLAGERDRQRKQREQQRIRKAQASINTIGNA